MKIRKQTTCVDRACPVQSAPGVSRTCSHVLTPSTTNDIRRPQQYPIFPTKKPHLHMRTFGHYRLGYTRSRDIPPGPGKVHALMRHICNATRPIDIPGVASSVCHRPALRSRDHPPVERTLSSLRRLQARHMREVHINVLLNCTSEREPMPFLAPQQGQQGCCSTDP